MTPETIFNQSKDRLVSLVLVLIGALGAGLVPRFVRGNVLRLLRPAESAVRRLIVMAAQGVKPTAGAARAAPVGPIPRGSGERVPAFRLFDPRKRFGTAPGRAGPVIEPRIWTFDGGEDARPVPALRVPAFADDPVDANRLRQRIGALKAALDDLPKQARRLMRAMAVRKRLASPLRPGLPPGYREKSQREVDRILYDCQALALRALAAPDTS